MIFFLRSTPFLVALLLLLLFGCKSAKPSPASEPPALTLGEVQRVYDLYLTARYPAYVAEIASCDNTSETHRRQMADLLRTHAYRKALMTGGTRDAHVQRLQTSTDSRQVNAFVRVNYKNNTHEEVLLSFVYVNRRWRLR